MLVCSAVGLRETTMLNGRLEGGVAVCSGGWRGEHKSVLLFLSLSTSVAEALSSLLSLARAENTVASAARHQGGSYVKVFYFCNPAF